MDEAIKIEFNWECLDYHEAYGNFTEDKTHRAKVFGGWVVRTMKNEQHSMCFVPDPKHEWSV